VGSRFAFARTFNNRRKNMTKNLPKNVYVKFEKPANGEPYLIASEQMYGMIEIGEKTVIGTYQLIETTEAEMVVSTKVPKKAR
jgi:hypothetical protein